MKTLAAILALICLSFPGFAQEDALTVDDLLRSAEQWARENLDAETLHSLTNVDRRKVEELFASLQKEFQGEYVVDLASLRQSAKTLLPLLEQYEETLPYAIWLRTRLDYLEVAEELKVRIKSPKSKPGQPPPKIPNPSPQLQREVWVRHLAERPWPKAAKLYVSKLKTVFAAEKVPAELVWVAEVESSFDPRARSPKGAAGLFQLMPATAKRFGLSVRPFDQRLKPESSAQAAAKYLKSLHSQFQDWRLTLAAYNAGEGTVQNLLKRHHAKTFDAIASHLPSETQMFVPKVEATLLRREGLKLEQLRSPA